MDVREFYDKLKIFGGGRNHDGGDKSKGKSDSKQSFGTFGVGAFVVFGLAAVNYDVGGDDNNSENKVNNK